MDKIANFCLVASFTSIAIALTMWAKWVEDEVVNNQTIIETKSKRFIIESEVSNSVQIIYDYDTKVQYLLDIDGGICVRVDENGKPMLHQN